MSDKQGPLPGPLEVSVERQNEDRQHLRDLLLAGPRSPVVARMDAEWFEGLRADMRAGPRS